MWISKSLLKINVPGRQNQKEINKKKKRRFANRFRCVHFQVRTRVLRNETSWILYIYVVCMQQYLLLGDGNNHHVVEVKVLMRENLGKYERLARPSRVFSLCSATGTTFSMLAANIRNDYGPSYVTYMRCPLLKRNSISLLSDSHAMWSANVLAAPLLVLQRCLLRLYFSLMSRTQDVVSVRWK